jgi:hypothetical protein
VLHAPVSGTCSRLIGDGRRSCGQAATVIATDAPNAYDFATIPDRSRGGTSRPRLEAPLARAKRTDRAAARRRYRAQIEAVAEQPDDVEPAPPQAAPRAAARGTAAASPARPGILSAFRASFRPIDLRGDIQALAWLVRTPAFFAPVILSGLSVALVPLTGANPLAGTLYQYFSYTAPLGTAFVAGFFAPRASYLLGMLAALASVLFQAIAFNTGSFGGTLTGAVDASGNPVPARDLANGILTQALFVGVPWCGFFAAAAAWYRRFLRTAGPGRQARPTTTPRRPDGRVAKRSEGRPLLARRR